MENEDDEDNTENGLLAPDHPLLEKFQKALKQHLLAQITHLKGEITEIENETKRKYDEKERLGVQTYEAQQMVCTQQKTLENLVSQIETITTAKEEVDVSLEDAKKEHKEVQEKYLKCEKDNRELQTEIESVIYLNEQMNQWEKKIESHISVSKRIASKTKKDYNLMFQEKRQQDMLIYNLTTAVWKLEGEIETLSEENKIKEKEVEELEQSVAVGNTNIEALQTEIRCLMHSWTSVVIAISNRDKGLECLTEEYRKLQEKQKSINSEIEQLKKMVKNEMRENEKLTANKTKVLADIKNCEDQMNDNNLSNNIIEKKIIDMKCIVDQTEKDIQECKLENDQKESTLSVVMKNFNKIVTKKQEFEEKLIEILDNRLIDDNVTKDLTKLLTKVKLKRRDMEIMLQEVENKKSLRLSEIETQKFNISELTRLQEDMQQQSNELSKEADFLQKENEKYETLVKKRERQIDTLSSKLKRESEKKGSYTSPKEMVILELEKNIEDTQESIKKLQAFWLREQKIMLKVSTERQEQIQNINILKKQMKILDQKNMTVNVEIELNKKHQENVIRNINNLQNKSKILCEAIFKKKNQKDKLDRTNIMTQSEYETKLRDAEFSVLQIESDIAQIEEDKMNISKELINISRECLEWEKKMQLAKDTVNEFKTQRSKSGELETMKLEIHKMEVIFGQMKKAQEKLMKDLSFCISRRENIFYTCEAVLKRQTSIYNQASFL